MFSPDPSSRSPSASSSSLCSLPESSSEASLWAPLLPSRVTGKQAQAAASQRGSREQGREAVHGRSEHACQQGPRQHPAPGQAARARGAGGGSGLKSAFVLSASTAQSRRCAACAR